MEQTVQNRTGEAESNSSFGGKLRRLWNAEFFRSCILLLIGILVLIFSFLPIYSYDEVTIRNDDKTIEMNIAYRISNIRMITYLFDALRDIPDEDMDDECEDLMLEIDELDDEITDLCEEWETASTRKRARIEKEISPLFDRMTHLSIRLLLRNEHIPATPGYFAGAILAILELLAAVGFLVVGILHLLSIILGKGNYRTLLEIFLCILPGLLLTEVLVWKYLIGGNQISDLGLGVSVQGGVTASIVLSLILLFGMVLFDAVFHAITTRTLAIGKWVTRLAIIALMIGVLCSLGAPLVKTQVTATFKGKEKPAKATVALEQNTYNSLTSDLWTEGDYLDSVPGIVSWMSEYTRKEVENGKGTAYARALAVIALEQTDATGFFVWIPAFVAFLGAAVTVCLSLCLLSLSGVKEAKEKVRWLTISRIICFVLSLVVLLSVILLVVITNQEVENVVFGKGSVFEVKTGFDEIIRFSMGTGSILACVFALLALVIPACIGTGIPRRRVGEPTDPSAEAEHLACDTADAASVSPADNAPAAPAVSPSDSSETETPDAENEQDEIVCELCDRCGNAAEHLTPMKFRRPSGELFEKRLCDACVAYYREKMHKK